MERKPIFEYRLNGEDCSEEDVIEYVADNFLFRDTFDYKHDSSDIKEAIQIIRANGETVEYLGT